jgi:hypothetical protein
LHPILRGGAVVARWAHNPKVGGSNPPSATKKKPCCDSNRAFLFSDSSGTCSYKRMETKKPVATRSGARLFLWTVIPGGSRDPPEGGERNPLKSGWSLLQGGVENKKHWQSPKEDWD